MAGPLAGYEVWPELERLLGLDKTGLMVRSAYLSLEPDSLAVLRLELAVGAGELPAVKSQVEKLAAEGRLKIEVVPAPTEPCPEVVVDGDKPVLQIERLTNITPDGTVSPVGPVEKISV